MEGLPPGKAEQAGRNWIRRPDLVEDSLSLPLKRLRSSLSELIQASEDREMAQELQECQGEWVTSRRPSRSF